jgi:radical SAM protein (TIGR01212 family)
MNEQYYSFNRYLREKFSQRVHRISIDAGFGCPNLDGTLSTAGCIFCKNESFSRYCGKQINIVGQIEHSMEELGKRFGARKFIAYFQPHSNTYADTALLKEKYDIIKKFPQIIGLTVSTRPDCIDEDKIKLIASYANDYLVWVEYGLQTTQERILKLINRNHTYENFLNTLQVSRKYNLNVAVHVILGLPTQTHKEIIEDALRISKLDIQGIKFHVLHVLKGTYLDKLYEMGQFKPLPEKDYVNIICDFLERIPREIIVLRLVSNASKDYLVAPFWINEKQRVIENINRQFLKRKTYQGYLCKKYEGSSR